MYTGIYIHMYTFTLEHKYLRIHRGRRAGEFKFIKKKMCNNNNNY